MDKNFFALVDNDDPTGNPTMEFSGTNTIGGRETVLREMTVEEMYDLANNLMNMARALTNARVITPGWEKRSYGVG